MSKHNTNCCVYGCHSRKGSDRSIHFHYFPQENEKVKIINKFGIVEEVNRKGAWVKAINTGKKVTKSMRVCSNNFKITDYINMSGMKLIT